MPLYSPRDAARTIAELDPRQRIDARVHEERVRGQNAKNDEYNMINEGPQTTHSPSWVLISIYI